MLGTILGSGMFFMAGAPFLQKYTPVVTWIGYIFWPFLKLVGMPNIEVAMQASGLSLLLSLIHILDYVREDYKSIADWRNKK